MKISLPVLLLVLSLMATGCAKDYTETIKSLDVDDYSRVQRHVVSIDPDGTYRSIPPLSNTDDALKAPQQYALIFAQIDAFLEKDSSCDPPPKKNILIYAHGGLNSDETAITRAVNATAKMIPDPKKLACADTYPIFINWRSGPLTTLGDHYFHIRDGKSDKSAPYTSPIYMVGDLAKTIGNTPMAWYHEGYQTIRTSVRYDNDEDNLSADREKYGVSLIPKIADDTESWNVGRKARWWVTAPIKIITTPFVFTFGTPAWDNMKRRTHTMFTAQKDDKKNALSPEGATRNFLKSLTEHIKAMRNKKKSPEFELTLMGHSMGGIIINRALRDLPDDLTEVDNLVYMASADNLQNYLDATIPLVKKKNSLRIYNLHLHPENEDREISSGGLAPSGSLLVWIDHTYDTPEYILQRTSGRWSNIRLVLDLIPNETKPNGNDLLRNYHFTVFGRGPTEKRPQTHGSFDDFNFWEKSYWTGEKVCWIDDEENKCSKESKSGITVCDREFREHNDPRKHAECLVDVSSKYDTCLAKIKSRYDTCMNPDVK